MSLYFVVGEILFFGLVIAAIALGSPITMFIDVPSITIIIGGGFAMALMSFTVQEISNAFNHAFGSPGTKEEFQKSAYFWECMIRNLLLVGVLATTIGLVKMLTDLSDPEMISPSMAVAMLTILYSIIVSAIFPLPAHYIIKKRILSEEE